MTQLNLKPGLGLWTVVFHLVFHTFTLMVQLDAHVCHALHLLKPVSKYFELDPRPLYFMLQWSIFWLEKMFKPFVAWEWTQDAITCSVYNHSFWNFHNSKVIERPAHWRHKIMAPSNIRLDLPLLQLLELVVFVFFW